MAQHFSQNPHDRDPGEFNPHQNPASASEYQPTSRCWFWCSKLEHALQSANYTVLAGVIQALREDDAISAKDRAWIAQQPVGIRSDSEPASAPLLAAYLLGDFSPQPVVIRSLIELGVDPNGTTPPHPAPLTLAIKRWGNPDIVQILLDAGATTYDRSERFWVDLPSDEGGVGAVGSGGRYFSRSESPLTKKLVDFRVLANEVQRIYHDVSSDIERECSQFIMKSGRLYDGYVYLRAAEEATLVTPELESRTAVGARFVELIGLVLSGRHPSEVSTLIGQIEDLMDNHPDLNHWHQSEPELALLLGHPRFDFSDPDDIDTSNVITRSLTGIHRLYFRGIQSISPNVVETIAQLGFATHSFRFFRFDTERLKEWVGNTAVSIPGSSLFEQFGLERLPPRATDRMASDRSVDFFGSGYVLRPNNDLLSRGFLSRDPRLDEGFHIEFRRAYILANHPLYGTLVVRNSSPLFGRDKLSSFAFWGPTPSSGEMTSEDLLYPERLIRSSQLRPALSAEGRDYKNVSVGMIQSQCVSHLVKGIIAVKDGYRRWKFDTDAESAWDTDPISGHRYPSGSGMHLSEGFPAFVSHLRQRMAFINHARDHGFTSQDQMPDLAFYHPYLPAWRAQDFEAPARRGGRDVRRSRLSLSEEVLADLEKLARRETRESDMERMRESGVQQFLIAGAAAQAELTMIAHNQDENFAEG